MRLRFLAVSSATNGISYANADDAPRLPALQQYVTSVQYNKKGGRQTARVHLGTRETYALCLSDWIFSKFICAHWTGFYIIMQSFDDCEFARHTDLHILTIQTNGPLRHKHAKQNTLMLQWYRRISSSKHCNSFNLMIFVSYAAYRMCSALA